MLSCEYYEIFRCSFFIKHFWWLFLNFSKCYLWLNGDSLWSYCTNYINLHIHAENWILVFSPLNGVIWRKNYYYNIATKSKYEKFTTTKYYHTIIWFFLWRLGSLFKENTIKTIYAANAGFAETFRWSFFGKKGIAHLWHHHDFTARNIADWRNYNTIFVS